MSGLLTLIRVLMASPQQRRTCFPLTSGGNKQRSSPASSGTFCLSTGVLANTSPPLLTECRANGIEDRLRLNHYLGLCTPVSEGKTHVVAPNSVGRSHCFNKGFLRPTCPPLARHWGGQVRRAPLRSLSVQCGSRSVSRSSRLIRKSRSERALGPGSTG